MAERPPANHNVNAAAMTTATAAATAAAVPASTIVAGVMTVGQMQRLAPHQRLELEQGLGLLRDALGALVTAPFLQQQFPALAAAVSQSAAANAAAAAAVAPSSSSSSSAAAPSLSQPMTWSASPPALALLEHLLAAIPFRVLAQSLDDLEGGRARGRERLRLQLQVKLIVRGIQASAPAAALWPAADARRLAVSALMQCFGPLLDLFPLLRLVFPDVDRDRVMGVSHRFAGEIFARVYGLASEGTAAIKDYKTNQIGSEHSRDQSLVAEAVLRDYCCSRDADAARRPGDWVTVGDVNGFLDAMARAGRERGTALLAPLAPKLTAPQVKWLMRIVKKDMKLGLRHSRALQALYHNGEAVAKYVDFTITTQSQSHACLLRHVVTLHTVLIHLFCFNEINVFRIFMFADTHTNRSDLLLFF